MHEVKKEQSAECRAHAEVSAYLRAWWKLDYPVVREGCNRFYKAEY